MKMLASFNTHVLQSKHRDADPIVNKYYTQKNLITPQEYQFKASSYAETYPEVMKYYDAPRNYVSDRYCDIIYEILVNRFFFFTKDSVVLSFDEVWCLIDGTKSPGQPWRVLYVNKQDMVTKTKFMYAQELWDTFYPSIFTVYPKSMIATPKKIEEGKVRTFMISPLPYNMCMMRYSSSFNHRLSLSGGDHPLYIGFNQWQCGWHKWIRQQQQFGNSWYSIDLTQCDSRVSHQFMVLEFRFRYASLHTIYQTKEHHDRFLALWSDQIYAHFWLDGMIFRKFTGNSSGQPNTIETNSFYVYMVFAYCYLRYVEDRGILFNSNQFDEICRLYICGDDAVFHFLGDAYSLLNYAPELGARVKLESSIPRPINQNSFVSNETVLVQDGDRKFYLPRLDPIKLENSWFRGGQKTSVRLTFVRTCQLMQFALLHEELYQRMDNFITFMLTDTHIKTELMAEGKDKQGYDWNTTKSCYKTKAQLYELYVGQTGSAGNFHSGFKILTVDMPHEQVSYENRDHFVEPHDSSYNFLYNTEVDRHNRLIKDGSRHRHFGDNKPANRYASRVASVAFSPVKYVVDKFVKKPLHIQTPSQVRNWIRNQKLKLYPTQDDSEWLRKQKLRTVEPNPGPPKKGPNKPRKLPKIQKKVMNKIKREEKKIVKQMKAKGSYIQQNQRKFTSDFRTKSANGRGKFAGFQTNRIKGSAVIKTSVTADSKETGNLVFHVHLNPANMGVAKLAAMAAWYQRFFFNNVTFRLETGQPQNEPGCVGAFYNSEIADDIANVALANRLEYAAARGRGNFKQFNVYQSDIAWGIPTIMTKEKLKGHTVNQLFYTDNGNSGLAANLTNQGTFTIIVTNQLGSLSSAAGGLGNLIVDYDITFFMAQDDFPVPPSIVSGNLKMTGAGGGFAIGMPLGLAPVVNFNSTQLTYFVSNGAEVPATITGFPPGTTRWLLCNNMGGSVFATDPRIALTGHSGPDHNSTVTTVTSQHTTNGSGTFSVDYSIFDVNVTGPNPGYVHLFIVPGATFTTFTSSSILLVSVNQGFQKPKTNEEKIIELEKKITEMLTREEKPEYVEVRRNCDEFDEIRPIVCDRTRSVTPSRRQFEEKKK